MLVNVRKCQYIYRDQCLMLLNSAFFECLRQGGKQLMNSKIFPSFQLTEMFIFIFYSRVCFSKMTATISSILPALMEYDSFIKDGIQFPPLGSGPALWCLQSKTQLGRSSKRQKNWDFSWNLKERCWNPVTENVITQGEAKYKEVKAKCTIIEHASGRWRGLPRWHSCKESASHCRGHGFDLWVEKIPWERE